MHTTTAATDETPMTPDGAVAHAWTHGTLVQRAQELAIINEWLDSPGRWAAPEEVRIAVRRTAWAYQREARIALHTLGGLAAAW